MKQMMNKVNPKAGTLKQTNETLQNVSRKLIAFVLMLALVAQPGSSIASEKSSDSCCSTEKKNKVAEIVRVVKLGLPSSESVKKADNEMNRNMYRSLKESKVAMYAKGFERSDAEMNRNFKLEYSISTPVARVADEQVSNNFLAENLLISQDVKQADEIMDAVFTANEKGIQVNTASAAADEWMTLSFQAENISLPSAEMIAKADGEISRMMNVTAPVASK